jgi:hypothetical protein
MKTKYNDFSDDELSKLISEKQAYIDKLWDEATLPWQDYVEEVNKTNIWEMEVELNNRRVPILRDADEFELDCRESYRSFKQSCKYGCFIDSDGSGYYGTETQISDIPVSCEAFDNDMERTDFKYVYWFNK